MNRIFKVVFNHVLGRHVVVSELASAIQRGACKAVAVVLTAGAALAVSGNAWAGSPYLAPDQSAVSNDSALDVYTVPGTTHQYTGDNAGIDVQLTQNAANGANVVVAGVSNMGTYTEGGKILLYQVESGSTGLGSVYYGEIETVEGIYKYTAVEKNGILYTNLAKARAAGVDVDSLTAQGYKVGVVKPTGGTISTAIQSASKPTSVTFGVRTQKKDEGYFQTQTITKKVSGTMNATAERDVTSEAVVQTGDVVTASVSENGNDLTISINGEETTFSPVHYYSVNSSEEQDNYDNDGASGENAVAAGPAAKAEGDGSVAVGYNTQALSENSIAIGSGNIVSGASDGGNEAGGSDGGTSTDANSIAIGSGNTVKGSNSIAIGTGHKVTGDGNSVIGDPNTVSGANNQVLANNSTVTGDRNVAIGNEVTVEANDGVAVGSGSQVSVDGGVALGSGSIASTDAGEVGYDPSTGAPSTETGSAWVSTAAAVAVGDGSTVTRQITGVAAGTQETDAVNVAQLKASQVEVAAGDNVTIDKDTSSGHTVYTVAAADSKVDSVKVEAGESTTSGNTTTTDYTVSVTSKEQSVEDGKIVTKDVTKEASFTVTDTRNKVVAGNNITVISDGDDTQGPVTYTINGKDTKVTSEDNSVTVKETVDEATGVTTYDLAAQRTSFAGDTGDTIANPSTLNVVGGVSDESQLTDNNIGVVSDGKDTLTVKLNKDVNLGEGGSVTIGDTKIDNSSVTTKTVNATDVKATNVTATTIKAGNTTINNNGMTIKNGPTITSTKVDMGGQTIHNVGRGSADTDAANVAQLRDVEANFDQKLNHLNGRIGEVAQDANAGIAMALAAASLPQAYLPGKSMMAVAGGTYRGEQGYAIGFSTVTDDGKWIIKANASGNTQGHYGAAIGAGYMW